MKCRRWVAVFAGLFFVGASIRGVGRHHPDPAPLPATAESEADLGSLPIVPPGAPGVVALAGEPDASAQLQSHEETPPDPKVVVAVPPGAPSAARGLPRSADPTVTPRPGGAKVNRPSPLREIRYAQFDHGNPGGEPLPSVPTLTHFGMSDNRLFFFTVEGPAGASYRLDTSTDLKNWTSGGGTTTGGPMPLSGFVTVDQVGDRFFVRVVVP